MSQSAIFVVQSALAMIFLAKGDFAFVSGCSTAVAAVVSRVLCCYVHIPQLLTVKPVLVNRVVFRIARASPTRLLMAVKDKYTRIKCSCQIKKKKQMFSNACNVSWNPFWMSISFSLTFKKRSYENRRNISWKRQLMKIRICTSSEIISIHWYNYVWKPR